MSSFLTHDDVLALLAKACDAAGGQRAWARRHGLSFQWVNNVLRGRAGVSPGISLALGLRKVAVFTPTGEAVRDR